MCPALRSKLCLLSSPTTKTMSSQVPYIKYISLPTSCWYKMKSIAISLPSWSIKIVDATFIGRIVGWQEDIFSDSNKSHIYLFWLIFNIPAWRLYEISHPIITFAFHKFFILNLSNNCLLTHSITTFWLAINARSST